MWISREVFEEFRKRDQSNEVELASLRLEVAKTVGENAALKQELTRHVADKDWFKHRLNQVEMERAALIYAATGGSGGFVRPSDPPGSAGREGVKISAPQFAMGPTVAETLNHQYNPFGTMGEDSNEQADQIPGGMATEDLTHMPGFKG